MNPENANYVFNNISSSDKTLQEIQGAEHVITCHPTRKDAYPYVFEFIERIRSNETN
ncbi:MAG: hypothetical protein ACFFDR_05365 [Candidatus Thorarchaeota archaeon]